MSRTADYYVIDMEALVKNSDKFKNKITAFDAAADKNAVVVKVLKEKAPLPVVVEPTA